MASGEISTREGQIIIPLRVGELTLGVVYLEGSKVTPQEIDLLRILSNQATVAIQNIRLYEMATLDPLTGVHARRFFDRWLLGEVRSAFRSCQPLSLLMMDVDEMKSINDSAGHLVGDQALAAMGKVLRMAIRNNDIHGRYGGDEFAVVLPNTDGEGGEQVGRRIHELLRTESVMGKNGSIPVRSSIGMSVLLSHKFAFNEMRRPIPTAYFQGIAQSLIRNADEAMYLAKRKGRDRFCRGSSINWTTPEP
jgi:diguanylate cyclase (GGDEF)-like protein